MFFELCCLFALLASASAVCSNNCADQCICYNEITSCPAPSSTLVLGASLGPATELCPGTFANADYLLHLTISDIPVLILYNESFIGLDNLETLDLSGNMLQTLPQQLFQQSHSLQQLDLSRNRLSEVDEETFQGLDNLTSLMLRQNNIATLTPRLLEILPSLTELTLSLNLLDCTNNASTEFIYRLVVEGILIDDFSLRCSDGRRISDLDITIEMPTVTTSTELTQTSTTTVLAVTSTVQSITSTSVQSIARTTVQSTVQSIAPTSTTESIAPTSTTESIAPTSTESIAPTSTTESIAPTSTTESIAPTSTTESIAPTSTESIAPTSTTESIAPTSTTETIAPTSTTESIAPTSTTESIAPTSTTESIAPTSTTTESIAATTTVQSVAPSPTPTPLEQSCPAETDIPTSTGYFTWPETQTEECATQDCPNGPADRQATRCCSAQGEWLASMDSECIEASTVTQLLAGIYQVEITEENSEAVSQSLASSLPLTEPLTPQEIATVTDIVTDLIDIAGGNVQVLNNTLLVIDTLLTSSGQVLTNNAEITARLREIIDSVLLAALNANNTQLVLNFSHLAVGGAYLPGTNQTTLLATIYLHGGEGVEVSVGAGEGGADVEVMVEGGSTNGSIQVTVYEDDNLFGETDCESEGVGGEVVTPVITVTDEQSSGEVVTITYNQLQDNGDEIVCARWNSLLNCGGGWETDGCALVTSSTGALQCRCINQGTYTIIDVPGRPQTASGGGLSLSARIVFYVVCGLTAPLYLTILLAVVIYRHLRSIPTMQCLVNLCLSQGLTFIVLAVSFERSEHRWVCYSLGVLLQYLVLLSLSWLVVYPVLIALKMFRRLWYEKEWLTAPFMILCWVWPAIPVAVYAGIRHSSFSDQPQICWLEASVFPSMFTYLSSFTGLVVVAAIAIVSLMLACSDYTVEASIYLQLASLFGNFLLYFGVVLTQFFAANTQQLTDYLLFVVACLVASCAVFFFVTNALAKSRIRSAILRKKDPALRQKVAHYSGNSSERTSQTSVGGKKFKRAPVRLTDEMNINYVDDYLGSPVRANPVPLSLFNMVQPEGRVARDRRSLEGGGAGFTNPAYHFQQTSRV